MSRYFPVTVMGGRVYPQGISEWGLWDPSGLRYVSEASLTLSVLDTKIDDPSQILKILDESAARPLPARALWVREGLEEEIRRI